MVDYPHNSYDPVVPEPPAPTAGGPCAAGGAAAALAAESPHKVIRGESPSHHPIEGGNPKAAFTDYLNVTFPIAQTRNAVPAFFEAFSEASQTVLGVMVPRGAGKYGYEHCYAFEHGAALFCHGGQRGTALISLPGEACALISDWDALVTVLRDQLKGRITRWDGAVDDFEGRHPVNESVALYLAGAFGVGGRAPSCSQQGNWICPDGSGRTFYVGKRKNGKLYRAYEKGMQLGRPFDPWVRHEVELHNRDRVVPWEVLLEPGRYVAGAYPALAWVSADANRIATIRRTDAISYERLTHYARVSNGPLLTVMLEREGNAEKVLGKLARPGVPKRLALAKKLGIRGDQE